MLMSSKGCACVCVCGEGLAEGWQTCRWGIKVIWAVEPTRPAFGGSGPVLSCIISAMSISRQGLPQSMRSLPLLFCIECISLRQGHLTLPGARARLLAGCCGRLMRRHSENLQLLFNFLSVFFTFYWVNMVYPSPPHCSPSRTPTARKRP